jgi:hypothetical protein
VLLGILLVVVVVCLVVVVVSVSGEDVYLVFCWRRVYALVPCLPLPYTAILGN